MRYEIKDKTIFDNNKREDISIELLSTAKKDRQYLPEAVVFEGREGNKWTYSVGYLDRLSDNGNIAVMKVSFDGMSEKGSCEEFRNKLESAVKEPWFVGRMYTVSDMYSYGNLAWESSVFPDKMRSYSEERARDDFNGIISRFGFIKDTYMPERPKVNLRVKPAVQENSNER